MVGVAVTGLAEADHPVNTDNAAVLYPDALGAPLAYRSKLPGVSALSAELPGVFFYMMPESAASEGLQRKKRSPLEPVSTTAAIGAVTGIISAAGVAHATRGSWNPLSGAFWENRGKGKNCSRNPFSSAYCGRSNPTKCSRNPLSRVRCRGNN